MVHFPTILAGIAPFFGKGGFQVLPAIFGVIAIVQVSQFHWYARDKNDPSKRFQRWLVHKPLALSIGLQMEWKGGHTFVPLS